MLSAFLTYAEFQGFWARFAPETPYGREQKDLLKLHTDPAALEAIWDRTDTALALLAELEADPVRLNRVSHHLKRLPRLPLEPRDRYSEVELFQFKKFLHNYQALAELLGPAVQAAFGWAGGSESFGQLLNTGRQSPESFYVADDYSPELKEVRRQLRAVDAERRDLRQERLGLIERRWSVAFGTRDFVLVARAALADPAQAGELMLVEPFDDGHWLLRPLAGAAELALGDRREALLAREQGLEGEVLDRISAAARQELAAFGRYVDAVRGFDLAFARARLAREWRLIRPVLAEGPVRIQAGRFLPCEAMCATLGTGYTPLDAEFDTSVTVVFGSNMGGKTVVLKTLAFLQLCVQTGLFAPAAAFTTRVFRHFHFVGEGAAQDAKGLSGFGREIAQFNAAWADFQQPTLALFDEFARTTQSQEAEALLSAAQEAMIALPAVLALFSTHFRGVRRFQGARYLRMGGLDRAGLERAEDAAIEARIRLINRHMDYRLMADDGSRASDALTVAALLGLDPGISRKAETYLNLDH